MIKFYTAASPSGWKVAVVLEELGFAYDARPINLKTKEQKEDWFLKLNPNGRVPVIEDDDNGVVLAESGAILIYLAEKAGALLPADPAGRATTLQWLMFEQSGLAPAMGQAHLFLHVWPERIPSIIERCDGECRRLFAVLDARLGSRAYLADEFSIADIANWVWVRLASRIGVTTGEFPNVARWLASMEERPAAQRGLRVPG